MNAPSEPPRSKGMMMVAAYRAERFSQRPVLRAGLRQAHSDLHHSRDSRVQSDEPAQALGDHPQPAPAAVLATPDHSSCVSVFADLVSREGATRLDVAAGAVAAAAAADGPTGDRRETPSAEIPPPDPTPAQRTLTDPMPAAPLVADAALLPDPTPAAPPVADAALLPDPAPAVPPVADAALLPDLTPAVPPAADAALPEAVATAPPAPPDPPLAEIGFGPGMLIRLSQLGLRTTGELARANPAQLRAELGDISRLIDVETWIAAARQHTKAGA